MILFRMPLVSAFFSTEANYYHAYYFELFMLTCRCVKIFTQSILKDYFASFIQCIPSRVPIYLVFFVNLKGFSQLHKNIILSASFQLYHVASSSVMEMMEKNELTAPLVNAELVFFLASALVTFPVVGAWIICTSFLS